MKKQSKNSRYVSAEKVQKFFSGLSAELTNDRKRFRLEKKDNSFIIHTNGGSVNITFNAKGGLL